MVFVTFQINEMQIELKIYCICIFCTIRYVVSVVNDVALARTIAFPLLLKVAKISLDKASTSQH